MMFNKRGNVLDFFFVLAILMIIGVSVFASLKIINVATESSIFADDAEASKNMAYSKQSILNFDNFMLFIMVGLSLFVIIGSAMVYNHPAFLIVGIILLFIAIMVSATVSNTFWTFSNDAMITSLAASFPKIRFIMDHLSFYILFMGMAATVAGYIGYKTQ